MMNIGENNEATLPIRFTSADDGYFGCHPSETFTPFLQSMRDLCVDISLGDGGHGADAVCGQSEGIFRESVSVGYSGDCHMRES